MRNKYYEDFYLLASDGSCSKKDRREIWQFISLLCLVCEIPLHGMSAR